jgi:ABC-type transporter Mla maintaining outer membrane lipid asymmetry permease subunit MlaE
MMVSMPLLVAEAVAIGIAASYFVAIFLLGSTAPATWRIWSAGRSCAISSWR